MGYRYSNQWLLSLLSCLGTVFALPQVVLAVNLSFTGQFTLDDDVELFDFSLTAPSTVTVKTLSYGGGTNAAGDIVSAGGFDPVVSLFDSSGLFLLENEDGDILDVGVDPVSENAFDSFLEASLDPGEYRVALTQFDNLALGSTISDGFAQEGIGDFTEFFGCSNGSFCDADGNNRTGAWALDIEGVAPATQQPVPEPSTVMLMSSGLLGLGLWRWNTSRA